MIRTFESGDRFLRELHTHTTGCILLDIRMPGTDGMDVQRELRNRNYPVPVIFITGHGDVPMAVQAMREGAFDFVQKPFDNKQLVEKLHAALRASAAQQDNVAKQQAVLARFNSLTPRERQVMTMVTKGLANKVIAMDLDVSQRTVEIHRARVMDKMEADSLPALVRMSILLAEPAN